MDRLREIQRVWNWLPAFRAVAETEHLPSAALRLAVTPPALSRSIQLLETALGKSLFRRVGRRLELNEEGAKFLELVREGMRRIHEAVVQLRSDELTGRVRVASAGLLTRAFVVPALLDVRKAHPELTPSIMSVPVPLLVPHLLQGQVDIAFLSTAISHPLLEVVHLGAHRSGVFCGRGHALHGRKELRAEELKSYEFVTPAPNDRLEIEDGWPIDAKRQIGFHVDHMYLGAEVCASGEFLAVLPDVVALAAEGLYRLPLELIPPTQLYGVHRTTVGTHGSVERVLAAVVERLQL